MGRDKPKVTVIRTDSQGWVVGSGGFQGSKESDIVRVVVENVETGEVKDLGTMTWGEAKNIIKRGRL
ncbi:MAG: hypothetical protein QXR18_09770 [Pyrobaculum sp.]